VSAQAAQTTSFVPQRPEAPGVVAARDPGGGGGGGGWSSIRAVFHLVHGHRAQMRLHHPNQRAGAGGAAGSEW
jgi:hypothetical protein